MEQSMLNTLEYSDEDLYVNNLTIVLDKLDPEYLTGLVKRFPEPVAIVHLSRLAQIPENYELANLVVKEIASYEASGIVNSSSAYSLVDDTAIKKAVCKELIGSPHDMVMAAPQPPADFDYKNALYIVFTATDAGTEYALAYFK